MLLNTRGTVKSKLRDSFESISTPMYNLRLMQSPDQSDQLSAAILTCMDRVDYFSRMQFFHSFKESDLVDKTAKILQHVSRSWGTLDVLFCADLQSSDVYLLSIDDSRVWQRDLEFIHPGEEGYLQTLAEWSRISRGCFSPQNIEETWDEDNFCIVKFSLDVRNFEFKHRGGDMLDMRIRKMINGAIYPTGVQFEVCDTLGMPNFVFVLTEMEKQKLSTERNWTFYNF